MKNPGKIGVVGRRMGTATSSWPMTSPTDATGLTNGGRSSRSTTHSLRSTRTGQPDVVMLTISMGFWSVRGRTCGGSEPMSIVSVPANPAIGRIDACTEIALLYT